MFSLLILSAAAYVSCSQYVNDLKDFELFKKQFNRNYDEKEADERFKCFQLNSREIESLNVLESKSGKAHAATYGWNKFTDMCPEEFKTYHNMEVDLDRPLNLAPEFSKEEVTRLVANDTDWRTKGAVTAIKDQGRCGSCWAFSSTGNMEGQHFLSGNPLVPLSEQELVSCDHDLNLGCNGGRMQLAFDWVVNKGGITSEANYPYTSGTGHSGTCDDSKIKDIAAKFSGHQDIPHDEDQMAAWVAANGPLSVAVDAANGWQNYKGGIMTTCKCGTPCRLDHGVLIVGFGSEGSTPYWIVKNSWNTDWGEQGYIRLHRGDNQCGIKNSPASSKV